MRLNAAVRNEITLNATKVLLAREKALAKREAVLALRCYCAAYPKELRNACTKVSDLAGDKVHFFNTRRDMRFNVAGQAVLLAADDFLPVPRYYQASHEQVGNAITLEKHPELVEDVRAWQADKEQFLKDKKLAEVTLKTMLKGVGSTESLFKVWPEGKKFYSVPPLTPLVKTSVPAVQVAALNTMLGLTGKEH